MTENTRIENYKERIKNSADAAESYTGRKQHKHDAEMGMIRHALSYVNGVETFLDAPCGTGRATIMLTRLGYTTTGVDLGDAAITVAKRKLKEAGVVATIEAADIEHLHYGDNAFDATLCFRLYHHFPNDEIRSRVIRELCRVSKKYVLMSYFSPMSNTSIRREYRRVLFNKPCRQIATSLASVETLFAAQKYKLIKNIPHWRFIHTLHLAVFKRDE